MTPTPSPSELQAQRPSAPTILVVDDVPANLRLLAEILGQAGYRVRPAISGDRALASIQRELPDLILLDIMMPGLDGLAVCRQLKADRRIRDIPVIFLSALSETFDKVAAFESGGVDYITKPFQVEEVLARVRIHLQMEGMRRQLQAQNQELIERNNDLDAFAGTVAHDLKNPIGTLIAALRMLQSDVMPFVEQNKSVQQMLDVSLNTAWTMAHITDELLLLATLRQQHVALQPLAMDHIVARALNQLQRLITERQPKIKHPTHWPIAQGYAPWIETVWVNYVSNALQHVHGPLEIELGATELENRRVRFWVRDNGVSLSPEAHAGLFVEFSQLDPQRGVGHGLGLSIVRRIMTKLGGDYGVSVVEPYGSEFFFILVAQDVLH